MAEPTAYETKAGTRYLIQYRKPDRTITKKRGFTSKRDARQWLEDYNSTLRRGEQPQHLLPKVTVNTYARKWLDSKTNLAEKTISAYENSLDHIKRYHRFGDHYVRDVTPELLEEWIAAMMADLSPKTIRNSYDVVFSIMKRAVRDRYISASPCVDIDLPRVQKKEQEILTVDQVQKMVKAAGERADLVWTLVLTGLRWGELAGLQVGDVDLRRKVINVRHQITENNGTLIRSEPKHHRRRRVGIMDKLAPILKKNMAGKSKSDLVFTTARGAVLRVGNSRRDWFDDAATAAGAPGLTPHQLRHTFASLAIKAGANPKALQASLGHSSITVTMDIYAHLYPDDSLGFVNAMSGLFSEGRSQNVAKDEKKTPPENSESAPDQLRPQQDSNPRPTG